MGKAKKKFDEVKKNIAGQVLTYNSKNFHGIKKNKTDYERIGKTI